MYIYYYKTLLLHGIMLGKYKIDYITRKWDSSNETEQNNFPKLTTQNVKWGILLALVHVHAYWIFFMY